MDGEVLSARLILTLGMAVAGLFAAFLAGRYMERDRIREVRARGADILYDDIADMIDAALKATGWRMVHQAEQVELALKRRLGGAFSLANDLQKNAKAAAGVFRDKPKDDHGHKGHGHGHGHAPAGSGVVYGPPAPAAAQANSGVIVMVGGSTGDAASHAHGGGHGSGHGEHGHDDHHGHEPGLEDRQLQVRKALEAFRKFWSDRGARVAEIKQAQRELAGEA